MRPFAKLRGEIAAHDISHSEFADGIGLSSCAVSQRLNCHKEWRLNEMYAAMDFFGLPYSQLPEYFPPYPKKRRKAGTP